jgi:hypothetical protein
MLIANKNKNPAIFSSHNLRDFFFTIFSYDTNMVMRFEFYNDWQIYKDIESKSRSASENRFITQIFTKLEKKLYLLETIYLFQ